MTDPKSSQNESPETEVPRPPPMQAFRVSAHEGDDVLCDDDDLTSSLIAREPSEPDPAAPSSYRAMIREFGNFLASFTLITMLIIIPLVTYRALREGKKELAAFDSAFVMVLGTVVLSLRLLYLHLTHYFMPQVQKYVVRIILMVPIYAIQSWLSLRFHHARIYIDAARDLYEAFVIASFVYYLIELLGGQDALVVMLQRKAPNHHLSDHSFPLNLVLQPWELGIEFMLQCKHGVLQYVVVKAVATVLTFVLEYIGWYGEGKFELGVFYPYMAFFLNLSVMYALYCLVKLFHAVNEELRHPINWRPLGKFLVVKGVVFFCWWQGVVIFYLQSQGVIGAIGSWNEDEVANGLIDYCVCIEMVFFAIAHSYTFTYKEYLPREEEEVTWDSHYRPPAALDHPMTFQDAVWNSTMPRETIHDLQRLRNGVDSAVNQALGPGAISLANIQRDEESPSSE